jgi:DNA polymerase
MSYNCQQRCPNCPTKHNPALKKNVVPGRGPRDARIMLVLEGPGRQENNFRKPAVGKTGDELDGLYFPLAGLQREDAFVTNTFKCHWADAGDTPPQEVITSCAEFHLRREIEDIKPEFVILAGGIACSLLGLDVEMEHGIVQRGSLFDHPAIIMPSFHPALGMHQSNRMQNLMDDWKVFKSALRGQIKLLKDEYPNPKYYRLTAASEVDDVMGGFYDEWMAVDTESIKTWKGYRSTIKYQPYMAQFCHTPGEAFMVKIEDSKAWKAFGRHYRKFRKIIMQNAPHDIGVLLDAGIETEWRRVRDTMSMAYHDGRMAKGLKSMAYRLLGMRMRSFEDVVIPWGIKYALDYILEASTVKWPKPVQEWTGAMDLKKCPECKGTLQVSVGRGKNKLTFPCEECDGLGVISVKRMSRYHSLNQKINGFIGRYLKNPDGAVKVWENWEKWGDDRASDIDALVAKLGPIPLASIEQAPEKEQLVYACGDAHGTKRIEPILAERLMRIRRSVRG